MTSLLFALALVHPLFLPIVAPQASSRQSADTPAQEARTPSVVLGSKEERVATAAAHYENNRPLEAALGFEGLWRDYPQEFRFLFNAAASRRAAGHNAHAVAYTREYLERARPQGEDRVEAEAQLREALADVAQVRVALNAAPGGIGQVTVVAQHLARDSGDVRPELLFPVTLLGDRASLTLELDPGFWMIRVQGAGYSVVEQRVEVGKAGRPAVNLQLVRAPVADPGPRSTAPSVPPEVARKMKLGFGVSGGLVAGAGIVVTAVGGVRYAGLSSCSDPALCVEDFARQRQTRALGVIVLGSGLGLLGGGLTWIAREPDTRRKVWIAQTALGGASLVGGLVGLFFASRAFNDANIAADIQSWNEHYNKFRSSAGHAFASAFFGAGAGLLVSSVPSLLTQRKFIKNVRLSAALAPGQSGVTLSGSF